MNNLNKKNDNITPEPIPTTVKDFKPVNMPAEGKDIPATPMIEESEVNPTEVIPAVTETPVIDTVEAVTPDTVSVTPVELNTNKKKSGNFLFFLVVIILLVATFFIDNVVNLLTEDNFKYLNGITPDTSSSNLINGFIKVGENNSFIKLEKVKFYNFKQAAINTVTLDYVSDKSISKPENLEIYIELYNSNQELLYKEPFNPEEKIENGVVSQYSMYVTNDVYLSVFYAKVTQYTKAEKASVQTLTCSYNVKNNNIEVIYKNTYSFINYELASYSVSKSFTSSTENAETEKYNTEIKNEYLEIEKYNITNNYKDNLLTYSIDLNNYPEGYAPLYTKGTVAKTIQNKEKLKKWTCE